MGRKGLFAEKPKKGPGRKAKKQGPPVLSRQFKGKSFHHFSCFFRIFSQHRRKLKLPLTDICIYDLSFLAEKENKDDQLLSHRQKQRLVKRVKKQEEKKIKMSGYGRNKNKQQQQPKKKYNSDSDGESDESDEDEEDDEEQQQQEEENDSESDDENETPGFTDENSEWLKPKKHSKAAQEDSNEEQEEEEEEDGEEEEEEEDSDDEDNLKVH